MSSPAKKGAFASEETSKFKTSFHAYGSMLVRAIGSATRTSARRFVSSCDRRSVTCAFLTEQEQLGSRKCIVMCGWSAASSFGEKRHILQPELILTASPPRSVHKLRGR